MHLCSEAQVLLDHALANWVIEVLVLRKCVQCQLPVDLVESTEQRSNILHAADLSEKISCTLKTSAVGCLQSNLIEGRLQLNVLGRVNVIHLAQELSTLGAERFGLLNFSKENQLLVRSERLYILGAGLERLSLIVSKMYLMWHRN